MKRDWSLVKLYCVEHARIDGGSTFEVFRTLKKARCYAYTDGNWNYENVPLYIFSADYNSNYVYEDENGHLNYDDCSDLYQGDYKLNRKNWGNTSIL